MKNYEEDSKFQPALRVAKQKGYDFLIEYAAHEIAWEEAQRDHTDAKFVAHHETLTDDQRLVLKALKDMGELRPDTGYYNKDYLPRPALEKLITDKRNAIAQKIRQDNHRYAVKVAEKAGYGSLEEFAVYEVNWNDNPSKNGQFIAYAENITPHARIVLDELKALGKLQQHSTSDNKNNYIPRPDLENLIKESNRSFRKLLDDIKGKGDRSR